MHTFGGVPVFSAYYTSTKTSTALKSKGVDVVEYMTRLVHAFKHPKDPESQKTVNDLVDSTIDDFISKIKRTTKTELDESTVIVPIASSSKLNQYISNKIKEKIPGSTILSEHIIKKKWKDVKFSDAYEREKGYEKDGKMRQGPERAAAHLARMQSNEPDTDFEVKKAGTRGIRRYFSNFLGTPTDKEEEFRRLGSGAKIILVDDTLDEGVTFNEAVRLVRSLNPEVVVGYIFLWRK
jgi:predicted amidophosphoribosyltransferase